MADAAVERRRGAPWRRQVGVAQAGDRRAPRRRRRTRRGARCSRRRRASWAAPESTVTSRQSPRSSGTGVDREVAEVDPQRVARPAPQSTASWSSRPVRAPTWSFSTREQSFASSTRSAGVLEQREAQRGRQRGGGRQAGAVGEVALDRQPARADRRGRRRAARRPCRGRTRASRVARLRRARTRRARRGRARAPRSGRRRSGSAVTVTPRSIANGSARPVVVVRVLADQVHAAGAARDDARLTPSSRRRITRTASGLASISR